MQVTIQKKFLIFVEVSENIFRVFLVVVNFVFDFILEKVGRTFNFIRALFGFNIYKLEAIQIKTKTNFKNNFIKNRNQDFLIYSNLLSPPQRNNTIFK